MSASPSNSLQSSQLADPAELGLDLLPAFQDIYNQQKKCQSQFQSDVIRDIFYHAFKYPQQTTYGFLIGKMTQNQLHIVEAVPISHTTHLSPTIFQGALEITLSRLSKTVDLSTMRDFLTSSETSSSLNPSQINSQLSSSSQSEPNFTAGITNNSLMNQIEQMIQQEERLSSEPKSKSGLGKDFIIDPNSSHSPTPLFSSPELFFSGLYICPSPTPKISEDVINIIRAYHSIAPSSSSTLSSKAQSSSILPIQAQISEKPSEQAYMAAKKSLLHATIRSIPYPFIQNALDLIHVCPNPTLTILDPILLNLLTNSYTHHRIVSPKEAFCPTIPSLLTYFFHDDVIMTPLNEILTNKNIHDLLFIDPIDYPEEAAQQPTTTIIPSSLFTCLMKEITQRLHMTLIDWQEASGE